MILFYAHNDIFKLMFAEKNELIYCISKLINFIAIISYNMPSNIG